MSWLEPLMAGAGKVADFFGAKSAAQKNIDMQKEFAQSGIQWKVKDAEKAGVHPLFALGAQTHSFSPVTVGSDFSGMGQNFASAISATQPASERALTLYEQKKQDLTLQNMELQNAVLASRLATSRGNPPMPSPTPSFTPGLAGQPAAEVVNNAMSRTVGAGVHGHSEPAAVADVGWTSTDSGGLAPVYSQDAKQRLEDDWLGMVAWNLRNRLMPSIGFEAPPPHPAPRNKVWIWNPLRQEYFLQDIPAKGY